MSRERARKKWTTEFVRLNIEPPRPQPMRILAAGSGVSLSGVPQTVDALLSDRTPSEKRFFCGTVIVYFVFVRDRAGKRARSDAVTGSWPMRRHSVATLCVTRIDPAAYYFYGFIE